MKKVFYIIALFSSIVFSQVPQGISHRGTVYDTTGALVSGHLVKIKTSILEGTTIVYSETHTLMTNSTGQYSLNIGTSTTLNPPNVLFNTINWGNGINKELKVEIDPTGTGSSFPIVGQNQLMSVPYALFAQNANINDLNIVSNINTMLTTVMPIDNKLVYVKGYFQDGDGGEGFFIFKKNNSKPINLGTIFQSTVVQNDGTTTGRWIRQYSGYMNVEFFGVQRDWDSPFSGFSNSDRIQNMIDYATTDANTIYSHEADLTIYFPNGQYFIDKPLILKDRVKLLGSPGTLLTNKGDSYDYMFKIDSGPVTNFRMENLNINLNDQPNVGGIHIKGILNGNPGGLWDANFKNIRILSAKGTGIFLEGGESGSGGNLPNQFILFENVRVYRKNSEYYALKITGENANYTFLNCEFLNTPYTKYGGGCIYIGSQNSAIPGANKVGASAISFINSGFGGNSEYGAVIENSGNITFDTCFIEGTDYAFSIKDSEQINILRSRFANASGSGSLASSYTSHVGRIILAKNSIVNVESNRIVVSHSTEIGYPYNIDNQKFIEGIGNNNVINAKNNSFSFSALGNTSGIIQSVSLTSNKVYLWSKKLVYINVPATYNSTTNDLNIITSDINATENFYLRANGGSLKINAMTTTTPLAGGRNIYLNGKLSITLNNGQMATFVKIDNAGGNIPPTYQLVSIAN